MATLGNTLPSTSTSTTTTKPIVCPWYCYPIGVFAILALLILLTLCISACDYRYSKKRPKSKATDSDDEKASVGTAREKREDDESVVSVDTDER